MLLGRKIPWLRGLGAGCLAVLALLLAAPGAAANTGDIIAPSDPAHPAVDSGWQAGTCTEEPPESAEPCSIETPEQFFETAGAHPNWGFTQFIIKHGLRGVISSSKARLKTVFSGVPDVPSASSCSA